MKDDQGDAAWLDSVYGLKVKPKGIAERLGHMVGEGEIMDDFQNFGLNG